MFSNNSKRFVWTEFEPGKYLFSNPEFLWYGTRIFHGGLQNKSTMKSFNAVIEVNEYKFNNLGLQ